jgi:CsoR family transcriptional regulator, copper-sensing transcriptional repressor
MPCLATSPLALLGSSRYHTPQGYKLVKSTTREEDIMRGYYQDKDDILARLRRIEGQTRGLQRMVANDDYCIEILTQITAASNALKKVAVGLLDDHIRHCVVNETEKDKDMVHEATAAIERLLKA